MNAFSMRFVAEFAELLTTALIHFVWQGAVLTLILLVMVKMLNVKTARLRYLLSVGTLLTMGMTPFLTILLHNNGKSPRGDSVEVSGQSNLVAEEHFNATMTDRLDADLQTVEIGPWNANIEVCVLVAWLAGVLILSTRLAIGFGFTLWIRGNLEPLSEQFEQRVRILGGRLRVHARQRVFATMRVGQAMAVGVIRPVVLIPVAWLTQLTPEMLEAVIAHELAHIHRWDLWVNLVQRVIETLLFYHPAVWWLSRRIHLEREMCCDEIAAACFGRAMYARSLESVAKLSQGNPILATSIIGGTKMKLLNRIQHLLRTEPAEVTSKWWAAGLVAMIIPIFTAIGLSITTASKPSIVMADEIKSEAKRSEAVKTEPKVEANGDAVADDDSATLLELKQQLQQIQKKLTKLEQKPRPVSSPDEAKIISRLFKHRVPFEIGRTQTKDGGRIEIREVWGTRPQIEVGGQYLVRGKYVLPPGERGKLYFYATASGEWGRGMTFDLQSTAVTEQEGEFELVHGMCPTGQFHLILTDPDRYSRWFANVYFGTGEHLYR